MITYRITEDWSVFQKFITVHLSHIDTSNVCYLNKKNETSIYIRFNDNLIGEIIAEKYTLIPSNAPDVFKNDGWTFTGNRDLFNS